MTCWVPEASTSTLRPQSTNSVGLERKSFQAPRLVLQVSAVLFNSIPVPPFDGYNVLEPFLPEVIRAQADRFAGMAIWVILLLFWFVPVVSNSFWETVYAVSTTLGVDWGMVIAGLERFRFWEL